MSLIFETFLILAVVSISCALMGSLLFLKESLMVADAMSHTVLLGIVLAFALTHDLTSPWLTVGATIFGVITVISIQLLVKTGRVANDAAIGLVFPLFFAIAVILISRSFADVHLDMDMVFLGQIELSPLRRTQMGGGSLPTALVQGVIVLVIDLIFILVNYLALKISIFDGNYAKTIGINVALLDLILMTLVSLTAVSAFDSVGTILVVALMAGPAMTARLLTNRLSTMLTLASFLAVGNAWLGYTLGHMFNTTIAGMCAVISFVIFMIVFVFKQILLPALQRRLINN